MSIRKTAEVREKDLRLAILRIKRGRSVTGTSQLSITTVAREAGVSPALIHNHYPAVADAIRLEQLRGGRAPQNRTQQKLKLERNRARVLREEIAYLRAQVARLASINEVLRTDIESLRGRRQENVVPLTSSNALQGADSKQPGGNRRAEGGSLRSLAESSSQSPW